jgi:glutamine amidotransferase PdxT
MKIGVLALQGAFREHLRTLDAIGVEGVPVRLPSDLEGVSGLILPGGDPRPCLERRAAFRDVRRDDRHGP